MLLALWLVTFVCLCSGVVSDVDGSPKYSALRRKMDMAQEENEVLQSGLAESCKVKGDFITCLQLMVLANVSDMAREDVYRLTDGLVMEKVNDPVHRNMIREIQKLNRDKDVSLGMTLLVRKTLDAFRSHALRWRLLPGLDVTVFRHQRSGKWDLALEQYATTRGERMFGARRRIVMMMLPIVYKLGVMTAMLAGLTVLTLKSITISVILLIFVFGNVFKNKGAYGPPHWAPRPPLATDIHVHVHTDKEHQYTGWEPPPVHQEYQHHPYRRYDYPAYYQPQPYAEQRTPYLYNLDQSAQT